MNPIMPSQYEKAITFRDLHGQAAFIIPNPWDVGSARLLQSLGFSSLATTSAGYAFSRGKIDNTVSREETMAHLLEITSSTQLPVSADLVNGFGDAPDTVSETIHLAAAAGVVGGSIEDYTGLHADPIYSKELAVERIRAAAETARGLPFPFMLTARAENYSHGRPNLPDTIARLQAYQDAGADVLFAPGLVNADDIAALVRSVDRPVNVMSGLATSRLTLAGLSALGVKRVSVGASLCRTALGAFLAAANELHDHGSFSYATQAISSQDITKLLQHANGDGG